VQLVASSGESSPQIFRKNVKNWHLISKSLEFSYKVVKRKIDCGAIQLTVLELILR